MQKQKIFFTALAALMVIAVVPGCYKLQKDYEYRQTPLDPHVNKTAKDYLLSRSDSVTPGRVDTTFRWMKKAIEYAGIDWAEYEKPNRTYIFLHTNAVRTISSGKITAGFFFDYPIIVRDGSGNPIPSVLSPGTDSTRIPTSWNEYSQETVKNYLLSLIVEGNYTFENLKVTNTTGKTLLPANTVAGGDSKLSYVVTKKDPNPDAGQAASITMVKGQGTGFDPEGMINFKLVNNSDSPLTLNDRTNARTGGILATNGPIHVFDKTVHPFRYSYF
jgi:hypothetical protein